MKFKIKKLLKIILIGNLFLIVLTLLGGCDDSIGQDGISSDISDSKWRGVFIREYEAPQNPYIINDSLKIFVKSAWLEKSWKGSNNSIGAVVTNNYQLIVITNPKDIEDIIIKWTIGIDSDRYFYGSDNNSIVTEFKSLPNNEIEIWKVQQGNLLKKGTEHKIIGEFRLKKK